MSSMLVGRFRCPCADGNGGAVYDEIASIAELGLPGEVIPPEAGRGARKACNDS